MNQFDEQDYTKQFDLKLWKKIYSLMKSHKKNLIILLITMITTAACDTAFPLLTKYAIDGFINKGDFSNFPLFVLLYAFVTCLLAFTIFSFLNNSAKLESGIVYDIRKLGFKKLQELSFSYYDNTPVGWIMARMTSDAQRLGDVIAWSMLDLIWGPAMIIISFVNMAILNFRLMLITIAVFPFLIIASYFFQTHILKNQREVRKINSKITGAYNEGITGARTTKTLIREEKNFEEFRELTSGMRAASLRSNLYSAIYMPIVLSIGSLCVGLVIWLGGVEVQGGLVSLGTYTVFITYALNIFDPIQQIARVLSEFQSAQASAERTLTLVETESDIQDAADIIKIYGDALDPKKENWPVIKGAVTFENVSFSYKTGEKVLENFNLTVRAGEKIALVGETGSGKSTIVNLVCRFYEPTAGKILIDGVDYRERSQIWLQSSLGYVLQSPHLFSGTIKDNIRYGRLDATDDEIIAAAKTVNAYSFIMKLDKGFDTSVGEGGSRLSSGEKQLISFARAILADPKIFVLDEATSSIDTETEQVVSEAVNKVLSGRTSFIVAHRLSTIRSSDRILVIRDGEIAESGNHAALIKKRGIYYNLYTNQFKEEEENKILGRGTESNDK